MAEFIHSDHFQLFYRQYMGVSDSISVPTFGGKFKRTQTEGSKPFSPAPALIIPGGLGTRIQF